MNMSTNMILPPAHRLPARSTWDTQGPFTSKSLKIDREPWRSNTNHN
jgi:hypothetical protein